MQLKKLAVICNACFWLTLCFQLWKGARNLHPQLLNSIVMVGMLGLVVNLVLAIKFLYNRVQIAVKENPAIANNLYSGWLLNAFNIFSFIAQITLIYLKYL